MKKLISLLLTLCICATFFAVLPASATTETITRFNENVLINWDGDLDVVADTTTSEGVVSYNSLKMTSKKVADGGKSIYPVDLIANKFDTSSVSILKYNEDETPIHSTYLSIATDESNNSYIENKWYMLSSTPKTAINVPRYLTAATPNLDFRFSFQNTSSTNGERLFTYTLGTTKDATDFLNLEVSLHATNGVTVTANGTEGTANKNTTYSKEDWNDFEVIGTFTDGAKATFKVYLNNVVIATVESQITYTFGDDLYISKINLQNGTAPSGGELKTIRKTNYDNITVSTFATPVDVVFDTDGGSVNTDKTQWCVGDTLPTPTLSGYTFAGWKIGSTTTETVTGAGTYVAQWTYTGGARASRLLNSWDNLLEADALGCNTTKFGEGGSYASVEGNDVAVVTDTTSPYYNSAKSHTPQFNVNYHNKVSEYLDANTSVLKFEYEILIPDDEYKTDARTFTLTMAKYDKTLGDSNSDRYVDTEDVVINFANGVAAPEAESSSSVYYGYSGTAAVKYGEWMKVSVRVHYVDGIKADYIVTVDGTTILKAVGRYDRDISAIGIRTLKFTQARNESDAAYFDTYYKNAVLKVENSPIEIIRGAEGITVKSGMTGVTGGSLIVGIYNVSGRMLEAFMNSTVGDDGLVTINIPVDTDAVGNYYSGSNEVRAFYWNMTTFEPLTESVERAYLYR